ncbi:MAG: phosphate acyltransferase PlsX [Solirubrobacterales bacterium]|nr:phosphate acyltransferase PlsX [Solirubrobacterales bacterium]
MVTVAVDAGGADKGAVEVAAGAAEAVRDGDIRVILFGDETEIGSVPQGVEVRHAPVSIAKAADPASAVRTTPEASVVQAARAVAAGEADAFVSGGSTGAALAAGVLHIRRQPGVHRPALALMVPVPGAPVLLLDVGASTEVRVERLVQHAHMGAAFGEAVFGMNRPRVALLSNGEEATRGTPEVVAAHALLAADERIHFVGNVEGVGIADGRADVIVTDGFTGNVALKLMEGVSSAVVEAIRSAATSDPRAAAGALLLRPALGGLKDQLDPEGHGGAHLLGLRKVAVIPHGRFGARGYGKAIALAAESVNSGAIERTHAALAAAGVLRGS